MRVTSSLTECCACHEIWPSRFTKCCACHEICTSRFTKHCCACQEICTSRFTKCCVCHELYTSRFTKCCACHEICTSRLTRRSPEKVFRCKNASKDNIQIQRRSFRARLPPISENEPHVEKSHFTPPVTKIERVEDHHHIQSAAPATKSALRSKPLRSLAPVTKSRLWTTKP